LVTVWQVSANEGCGLDAASLANAVYTADGMNPDGVVLTSHQFMCLWHARFESRFRYMHTHAPPSRTRKSSLSLVSTSQQADQVSPWCLPLNKQAMLMKLDMDHVRMRVTRHPCACRQLVLAFSVGIPCFLINLALTCLVKFYMTSSAAWLGFGVAVCGVLLWCVPARVKPKSELAAYFGISWCQCELVC